MVKTNVIGLLRDKSKLRQEGWTVQVNMLCHKINSVGRIHKNPLYRVSGIMESLSPVKIRTLINHISEVYEPGVSWIITNSVDVGQNSATIVVFGQII